MNNERLIGTITTATTLMLKGRLVSYDREGKRVELAENADGSVTVPAGVSLYSEGPAGFPPPRLITTTE